MLRPPPTSRPRLVLSAPPSPTPRRPAHAQHAARVARPRVGPTCSLAATSAAATKAAAGGVANELVGPRGRLPTAHPHTVAGADATQGRGDAEAEAAAAADVFAAVRASVATVVVAAVAAASARRSSPSLPPRRPCLSVVVRAYGFE